MAGNSHPQMDTGGAHERSFDQFMQRTLQRTLGEWVYGEYNSGWLVVGG